MKWRTILRDVLLILVAVIAISYWQNRNLIADGTIAPELIGATDLSGTNQDALLASIKGKKALVYFFAPWCTVCKFSASNLTTVQNWLGSNTAVLAVALDYESVKDVEAFVADNKLDRDKVFLGNEQIAKAYRVDAYPTYYVLNKNGAIASKSVGYASLPGMLRRLWMTPSS